MSSRSWDYIIVGGGSSGCVLASRLSEDSSVRVLLIEAGGSDRHPVILAPAATDLYALGQARWDWCHTTQPDPTRENRVDLWPRGRVLGGSSSINGTLYIRGHAADFDGWATDGAAGWSYRDVLPYFRRAETSEISGPEFHGASGPLSVRRPRYVHPLTERFVAAAVEYGLPLNPDLNGSVQTGVAISQVTQRQGWRHSSARAYLRPAQDRPNLGVLTHALVTRVIFAGSQAVGVEYVLNGRTEHVNAEREIILAAGAIGSPKVLLLSGIGRAESLHALGIPVIVDNPGVGENLQEHVGAWLGFRMRAPTLNDETSAPKMVLHALNWLLLGRGPATSPGAQAAAFTRVSDAVRPDILFYFSPVGYRVLGRQVVLDRDSTVSVCATVCRPRSRGRVRLQSADVRVGPLIEMPLLDSTEDIQLLKSACRIARGIMSQPAIARDVLHESVPGETIQSDEEWATFLRSASVPCYHPVGTCRMGTDASSVVDASLRVRGVTGIRVADASVMPRIVSGGTNPAAIMIGEKASDLLRGRESIV